MSKCIYSAACSYTDKVEGRVYVIDHDVGMRSVCDTATRGNEISS